MSLWSGSVLITCPRLSDRAIIKWAEKSGISHSEQNSWKNCNDKPDPQWLAWDLRLASSQWLHFYSCIMPNQLWPEMSSPFSVILIDCPGNYCLLIPYAVFTPKSTLFCDCTGLHVTARFRVPLLDDFSARRVIQAVAPTQPRHYVVCDSGRSWWHCIILFHHIIISYLILSYFFHHISF